MIEIAINLPIASRLMCKSAIDLSHEVLKHEVGSFFAPIYNISISCFSTIQVSVHFLVITFVLSVFHQPIPLYWFHMIECLLDALPVPPACSTGGSTKTVDYKQ